MPITARGVGACPRKFWKFRGYEIVSVNYEDCLKCPNEFLLLMSILILYL